MYHLISACPGLGIDQGLKGQKGHGQRKPKGYKMILDPPLVGQGPQAAQHGQDGRGGEADEETDGRADSDQVGGRGTRSKLVHDLFSSFFFVTEMTLQGPRGWLLRQVWGTRFHLRR